MKSISHRRQLNQMKILKDMHDDDNLRQIQVKNNDRTGLRFALPFKRLALSHRDPQENAVSIFNSLPKNVRNSLPTTHFVKNVDYYFEYGVSDMRYSWFNTEQ